MNRCSMPVALATLAAGLALLPIDSARAGDHRDGNRGAALYPGSAPWAVPFDGPIPGWRPPGRGDLGPSYPIYHPGHLRSPGPSIPGLWRYPLFRGFIPPAPHDDRLYQTGKYPWRRG